MAKKKEIIPQVENHNLLDLVVSGMDEMKAEKIAVIDLRKIKNAVADYFVICSGTSDSHVDAIADSIEKEVYKNIQQNPWRKEGKQSREWILLDYVDIVAHVFKKDQRKLYALEELWGDGIVTHINNLPDATKALIALDETPPLKEVTKKKQIEDKPIAREKKTTVDKKSISKPKTKNSIELSEALQEKKKTVVKKAIVKEAMVKEVAVKKVAMKKAVVKKASKKE